VTRILVVDDHTSLRNEIVRLVEGKGGLNVVGEAVNGKDAIEKARALRPDLILMDVIMPQVNGAEATRIILEELPETLILVLSNYSNRSLVRALFDAGARGYVRKDQVFEELMEAIETVVSGRQFIGSGLTLHS